MTVAAPAGDGRRFPSRPILAVSLAVFREGRVLLAQRSVPPFLGRFTLPGGVVDVGETMEEAALREMQEEVGVRARIIGFNRHVEIIGRNEAGTTERHYVIASYIGRWISGEGSVGPEAQAIVWAARDEVAALPTTEHLVPLLDGAWEIAGRACELC